MAKYALDENESVKQGRPAWLKMHDHPHITSRLIQPWTQPIGACDLSFPSRRSSRTLPEKMMVRELGDGQA